MSLTEPLVPTTSLPKWVTYQSTRFRVVSYETAVQTSIDDAWAELGGNWLEISKVQKAIVKSYGLPGPQTGTGAARHCDIDFNGKPVVVKERIIDWIDTPDHKEYTYDVYESTGFPAKVYNTWSLRKGQDGRTYLRNVFFYRMRPAIMTRPMAGQIFTATRGGALGYKHVLETGERLVDPKALTARYAN